MNRYFSCFSMFVLLTSLQAFAEDITTNDWGAVTNNVQMSIRLKGDKTEIKISQPVILQIRFSNLSTNETYSHFIMRNIEDDPQYSFVISPPSGKDILPDMRNAGSGDGYYAPLPPNESSEVEFYLSKHYDFDEIGTYKITAKKNDMVP